MLRILYFLGLVKELVWVKEKGNVKLCSVKTDPWGVKQAYSNFSNYTLKEEGHATINGYESLTAIWTQYEGSRLSDYFIKENTCPHCNCRTLNTPVLFQILKSNMFNVKSPKFTDCQNHTSGNQPYTGHSSYIQSVKWNDFVNDMNKYIDIAAQINENIENYNIVKSF